MSNESAGSSFLNLTTTRNDTFIPTRGVKSCLCGTMMERAIYDKRAAVDPIKTCFGCAARQEVGHCSFEVEKWGKVCHEIKAEWSVLQKEMEQFKEEWMREKQEWKKVVRELQEERDWLKDKVKSLEKERFTSGRVVESKENETVHEKGDSAPEVQEDQGKEKDRVVIIAGDANVLEMQSVIEDMVGECDRLVIVGKRGAVLSSIVDEVIDRFKELDDRDVYVILHGGLWDMLGGTVRQTRKYIVEEVERLAVECQEAGAKLTVCSIPHVFNYKGRQDYRQTARKINEAIQEALEDSESEFLFLNYVQDEEDCMGPDGLHFAPKGVPKVVRPIVRRTCSFLQRAPVWIHKPPEGSPMRYHVTKGRVEERSRAPGGTWRSQQRGFGANQRRQGETRERTIQAGEEIQGRKNHTARRPVMSNQWIPSQSQNQEGRKMERGQYISQERETAAAKVEDVKRALEVLGRLALVGLNA